MDITDSSGVQNPLPQPPKAMAYENHPYKGPYRGSQNGTGNCRFVNQGSKEPSYQSSGPKLFPGEGAIQDGGLADSEVPNTTRGLYDKIELEGWIL